MRGDLRYYARLLTYDTIKASRDKIEHCQGLRCSFLKILPKWSTDLYRFVKMQIPVMLCFLKAFQRPQFLSLAFLGWDSSGSSNSGRTSEITKWSIYCYIHRILAGSIREFPIIFKYYFLSKILEFNFRVKSKQHPLC